MSISFIWDNIVDFKLSRQFLDDLRLNEFLVRFRDCFVGHKVECFYLVNKRETYISDGLETDFRIMTIIEHYNGHLLLGKKLWPILLGIFLKIIFLLDKAISFNERLKSEHLKTSHRTRNMDYPSASKNYVFGEPNN